MRSKLSARDLTAAQLPYLISPSRCRRRQRRRRPMPTAGRVRTPRPCCRATPRLSSCASTTQRRGGAARRRGCAWCCTLAIEWNALHRHASSHPQRRTHGRRRCRSGGGRCRRRDAGGQRRRRRRRRGGGAAGDDGDEGGGCDGAVVALAERGRAVVAAGRDGAAAGIDGVARRALVSIGDIRIDASVNDDATR